MHNVIDFPSAPPADPVAPDWALLDSLLDQAFDWLASGAGAELYHGPNQATMNVIGLCRDMLNPQPPVPGTYEPQGMAHSFANYINDAATWVLEYYGDELDSEDHNRIVCLSCGTTEPAKRFGGWSSWGPEEVNYLLEELAAGHWTDCGEKVPGFAIATGGLHMAIAANEGSMGNVELRQIINGMWAAADYLVGFVGPDDMDERISRSLEAVSDACEWTGKPGEDAGRITRCRPTLR